MIFIAESKNAGKYSPSIYAYNHMTCHRVRYFYAHLLNIIRILREYRRMSKQALKAGKHLRKTARKTKSPFLYDKYPCEWSAIAWKRYSLQCRMVSTLANMRGNWSFVCFYSPVPVLFAFNCFQWYRNQWYKLLYVIISQIKPNFWILYS